MMYDEVFDRIHTERLYKEIKEEGFVEGRIELIENIRNRMKLDGKSESEIDEFIESIS